MMNLVHGNYHSKSGEKSSRNIAIMYCNSKSQRGIYSHTMCKEEEKGDICRGTAGTPINKRKRSVGDSKWKSVPSSNVDSNSHVSGHRREAMA